MTVHQNLVFNHTYVDTGKCVSAVVLRFLSAICLPVIVDSSKDLYVYIRAILPILWSMKQVRKYNFP